MFGQLTRPFTTLLPSHPLFAACGGRDPETEIAPGEDDISDKPDWLNPENITEMIDADAVLATGVHPLGKVKQAAAALKPGAIVVLTSGFQLLLRPPTSASS